MDKKKIILIVVGVVCVILMTFCCNKKNEIKLIAKAEFIESKDSTRIYNDTKQHKLYKFKLQLINLSKDTFKYWTMSCDTEINWILNRRNFSSMSTHGCDKNCPTTKILLPFDTLRFNYHLIRNDICGHFCSVNNIRFGYILIERTDLKEWSDFFAFLSDRYLQKKVIWTNEISNIDN